MTTHVLGPLCKRGHRHEGTDQSLRYASTRQCVECQALHAKNRRKENPEEGRSIARRYYRRHRDAQLIKMAEYRKTPAFKASQKKSREKHREKRLKETQTWRKNNKEHLRQYDAEYRNKNKEKIRARGREYRKQNRERLSRQQKEWREDNPDYARDHNKKWKNTPAGRLSVTRSSVKRRALKKRIRHVPYSNAQLLERFELFDHKCAYCGKPGTQVDHVVPIAKQGPDQISNIVPACESCNPSKKDRDVSVWYHSQPFFTQRRWQKILEHCPEV